MRNELLTQIYINSLIKHFLDSEFRKYMEHLSQLYKSLIFNLKNNSYTYNSYCNQYTYIGTPNELLIYKKFFRKIKYDSESELFTFTPEDEDFRTIIVI